MSSGPIALRYRTGEQNTHQPKPSSTLGTIPTTASSPLPEAACGMVREALAFGVPPMLLGLPGDATYANYREANRALWRLAILPLAGKILAALSEGLRPWFAGLTLTVDLDRVGALSEERERLWAQVGGVGFMTRGLTL